MESQNNVPGGIDNGSNNSGINNNFDKNKKSVMEMLAELQKKADAGDQIESAKKDELISGIDSAKQRLQDDKPGLSNSLTDLIKAKLAASEKKNSYTEEELNQAEQLEKDVNNAGNILEIINLLPKIVGSKDIKDKNYLNLLTANISLAAIDPNKLNDIPEDFGLREKVTQLLQNGESAEKDNVVPVREPQILQNPVLSSKEDIVKSSGTVAPERIKVDLSEFGKALPTMEDILIKPTEEKIPVIEPVVSPENVTSPESKEIIDLNNKVLDKITILKDKIIARSNELDTKGESDPKLTNLWNILEGLETKLKINNEKLKKGESDLATLSADEQARFNKIVESL